MMRSIALAAAICCGCAFGAGEDAPYGEVLTNDDVLALLEAGLSNEVVVAKIDATAGAFDTSVATLIRLSEDGVADSVLAAMARATEIPLAGDFEGTPCPGPGIYVAAGHGLVALDMDNMTRIGDGGLMATAADAAYGIVPTTVRATIAGTSAARRLLESRPEFWFCMPEAASPFDPIANIDPEGFELVAHKVHQRREERRFGVARFWMFGGGVGPSRRQQRALDYTVVRGNVYRATPAQPLPAGEYGFYYAAVPSLASYEYLAASGSVGGRIFSFGVDEAPGG